MCNSITYHQSPNDKHKHLSSSLHRGFCTSVLFILLQQKHVIFTSPQTPLYYKIFHIRGMHNPMTANPITHVLIKDMSMLCQIHHLFLTGLWAVPMITLLLVPTVLSSDASYNQDAHQYYFCPLCQVHCCWIHYECLNDFFPRDNFIELIEVRYAWHPLWLSDCLATAFVMFQRMSSFALYNIDIHKWHQFWLQDCTFTAFVKFQWISSFVQ